MRRVRHDLHRAIRLHHRLREQSELVVGEVVIGLAAFLLALLPPHFCDADLGEQRAQGSLVPDPDHPHRGRQRPLTTQIGFLTDDSLL